jgi:hypothetical protein
MLVNINKLKPYKFIEDKTLQAILVKPNDLVTNELVQTRKPKPLFVEPKEFQLVEFESICNYLTHVHHYHNVPIQDNDEIGSYDRNDMFKKAFINV